MNFLVKNILFCALGVALGGAAHAGPADIIDPDCTAEKAVKSAAAKATVGVGGRCSAGEAAKDTAKDAVGIDKKNGPLGRKDKASCKDNKSRDGELCKES